MAATGQKELPVLIVGGGIGGLAAALALSRKGRAVQLFEQAADFKELGAGIQLGPNVFRMFEILELTDAINQVAVFPENLIMMDGVTGEEVMRVPLGDTFRARYKYPYAVIYRVDLHHELLQACRRSSLISLNPGRKAADFEDAGDRVRLAFDDGVIQEGCALIGADGLWSSIRGRIARDGRPRVSGHIAYRAVLPIHEVPEELRPNSVVLWAGPKNHLVHYPLRRGELLNLVAVFHSDRYEEGWNAHGDVEELDERFKDNRPEVKTLLGKIDHWRMWVLCDREPIKEWSKGRVTLLGDAAHPMLQYLAQGAGMAIEDAVVLADKVAAAGNDFVSAFLAYQQVRYLRTGRVQLYARLYGDLYHASGVNRELRNLMLREAASKNRKEAMAWLYDGIALN